MNHLEIEYKTLLSKDEFEKLDQTFKHIPIVTQTNYYIDNPNQDIKRQKMSLRIRTYDSSAELTLKVPQKVGNYEYNLPLSLEEADHLIADIKLPKSKIKNILENTKIDLSTIKVWGSLTTKRRETRLEIGLLALDQNSYEDKTDYELELEVTDAKQGKLDFEAFLKQHQIQFKYAKSKVARVYQFLHTD
ncbi:CYTH domain-containing protein [Streptococcus pacificus]|uniref:CYTH domain-containing protein n=1 Tax=Streptococcus pacificus TaxID=2740577 RepID=A0ABS0ZHN4_9STRE|nr:CYTH domain-containing protein [Streptococcus pacificus]MBJ8325487.1 CYTH domain-containing protein [Streptococcus pacificus]